MKPCPFCGRTPTVEDCGSNQYFLKCECGIAQDKLYAQRCDAVRNWNNRKVVDKDLYDLVREERDIAAWSLGLIYSAYGENFDDVVKVVRCKDCQNWQTEWETAGGHHFCPMIGRGTDEQFYCADGERRDDAR